jgi:phosphoribosylanthranilate isomerase
MKRKKVILMEPDKIYPSRISFAGIDESVSVAELKELAEYGKERGFIIEFGVLLSSANDHTDENGIFEHKPRYPSIDYIRNLIGNDLNLSLHLCGIYAGMLMATGEPDEAKELIGEDAYAAFQRIQVNVVGRKTKAPTIDLDKEVIIQTNLNEQRSADRFELYKSGELGAVVFLSDASGGQGRTGSYQYYGTPKQGYAGGIRPENVIDVIDAINNTLNGNKQEYWIDLESGCRDDDKFSIDACKAIIDNITNAKEKGT